VHSALQLSDGEYIEAAGLALALLAATTSFHYEALRMLLHRLYGRHLSRPWVVRLVVTLVVIHGAEIALYAGVYALGTEVLGIGRLAGGGLHGFMDLCYFAAETYSTLGYGDLVPTGALRVLASLEAVNGVLLLTLSGAFLSGMLRDSYQMEARRAPSGDDNDRGRP
jgi:Ion channel